MSKGALGSNTPASQYGAICPEAIPSFPGVYLRSSDGHAVIMVTAVMVHGPDGDRVLNGNAAAQMTAALIDAYAQDLAPETQIEEGSDPPAVVDGAKVRKR